MLRICALEWANKELKGEVDKLHGYFHKCRQFDLMTNIHLGSLVFMLGKAVEELAPEGYSSEALDSFVAKNNNHESYLDQMAETMEREYPEIYHLFMDEINMSTTDH